LERRNGRLRHHTRGSSAGERLNGLACRVCDDDGVRDVVHDDGVVDVVGNQVHWRRRHIARSIDPCRNGFIDWLRQDEDLDRRGRRRQVYEIGRNWFEIAKPWRRRQIINRVREHQHRSLEEDDLFRRRGLNVVFDHLEAGWRRNRGRQAVQAPFCVSRVGTVRIAAQVRPVGARRAVLPRPAPRDRFAPCRKEGAHATGQRVPWIDGNEVLIALYRVALDRGLISLLDVELSHRSIAKGREILTDARRRGIGGSFKKHERGVDAVDIPRDHSAIGRLADAQADLSEDLVQA
jgi:hypothetical protein